MANAAKTAIVTGASRGIGAGLVEAFLKRGYSVVANSRSITKANPFAVSANLALVDGDIGDPRTAAAVFGATITTAAWKTKPSWCVIASNDRAVPPELQKAEAAAIKATSITVPSSHVPMLSRPKEVADLIEQAASKAGILGR